MLWRFFFPLMVLAGAVAWAQNDGCNLIIDFETGDIGFDFGDVTDNGLEISRVIDPFGEGAVEFRNATAEEVFAFVQGTFGCDQIDGSQDFQLRAQFRVAKQLAADAFASFAEFGLGVELAGNPNVYANTTVGSYPGETAVGALTFDGTTTAQRVFSAIDTANVFLRMAYEAATEQAKVFYKEGADGTEVLLETLDLGFMKEFGPNDTWFPHTFINTSAVVLEPGEMLVGLVGLEYFQSPNFSIAPDIGIALNLLDPDPYSELSFDAVAENTYQILKGEMIDGMAVVEEIVGVSGPVVRQYPLLDNSEFFSVRTFFFQ